MSITSSRRSAPPPATASASLVTAVHTHLQTNPAGMSLSALVEKARFPADQVADAVSVAVDSGLVRFGFSSIGLQFYAAEHKGLSPVAPAVIDHVVNFIAAHEDYERGSPDVVLAVETIIGSLKGTHSQDQVLAAFHTLRQEETLWFRLSSTTGRATVTLSRHRSFTIVGQDDNVHEPLCFHVRAGTSAVAVRKVEDSSYGGDELSLHGIVEGEIHFQAPKGRAMLVVRL